MRLPWVFTIVALAACQKSAKPAEVVPDVTQVTVTDAAPAPVAGGGEEPPAKALLPADLPPFGAVATADRKKSDELLEGVFDRILFGFTDEDNVDPETVDAAVAAVRADPGSPMARYALACVMRNDAAALKLLEPLSTATSCPECADTLRNVRGRDNCDFGAPVVALGSKVTPSKQRLAAEAIVGAIGSHDPSKVGQYFKSAKTEWIMECYSMCDTEPDTKKKMTGAKLLREVTVVVKKQMDEDGFGGLDTGGTMSCRDDCCSVTTGMVQHNMDFLQTICFAKGSDQVRSIRIKPGG